jgi:hypothetical protein
MLEDVGNAKEKEAIILNITKARGAIRTHFLVVGIFLFVLTVTPKQEMDNMKKVWKLRGAPSTLRASPAGYLFKNHLRFRMCPHE